MSWDTMSSGSKALMVSNIVGAGLSLTALIMILCSGFVTVRPASPEAQLAEPKAPPAPAWGFDEVPSPSSAPRIGILKDPKGRLWIVVDRGHGVAITPYQDKP